MTTSDRGRDAPGRDQLAAAVTQLTAELAALRRDLARRHLLDLASGVLVAQLSLTPADAVDHLAQLAETTGIAPEDLAADIVNGASGTAGLSPLAMAADLGEAAADEDAAAAADAAADADGTADVGVDEAADIDVDQERTDARRARLTEAAAEAAAQTGGTVDEVAETLLDGGLRPLGVRGLWLFRRTETDCLELAGQAGVSPLEAAHWRWVPPGAHSPLHRVLTEAAPAWLPAGPGDGERLPGPAPDAARAVLPLRQRGAVTGLALADWPGPRELDEPVQRALMGLAVPAARILDAGGADPAEPAVLAPLLDQLTHPAMSLRADPENGALHVEHLNRPALDSAGRTHGTAGRPLAQVFPAVSADLAQLARAARESAAPRREARLPVVHRAGDPDPLHDVRVLPVGPGRTVVLWHGATDPLMSLTRVLGRLENLAAFEDDLIAGTSRWSEQAYRIFGLDPAAPAVPLRRLAPQLHRDETDKLHDLLTELTERRHGAHTVVRVVREDGGLRHVRIAAEPLLTGGVLTGITGVYQDVSAQHHTEIALSATYDRLTAAQTQAALRHQLVVQLQQAIVPEVPVLQRLHGLEVAARYRPAAEEYRVGGDWYDVLPLPGGRVLVAVGDIAGHGIDSVTGMVALRNALRGLAFTGHSPARLMSLLNEVTLHTHGHPTATAVCALYDPAERSLCWASAGHLPPLLLRDARARFLDPPRNILLGAVPSAEYAQRVTPLAPGDTLMLYTDGLVERRHTGLDESLAGLRRAAERLGRGGLDERTDRLLASVTGDTDDDTSLVVVRVS
ncbi:SpoIIE family protein phosphatase [Streptomyces sp. FIT100]|uniref:SpoIIE family protein phosphatase n=1 Tax=Streptomyces sp. FIT100 TaxID=2837956 RepID=UPI0021C7FC9E|nr:SpoIIE family protein phosphatase [Streptomyces sp. FIT100]UUN30480.1 SpoIIE family protein phosphatase [Streptomyces sp. FIT100]